MVSISGIMFCKSDIRKCENMHTEVENEFNKLFKEHKKGEKSIFKKPRPMVKEVKQYRFFIEGKSGDSKLIVETKDWASII